MLSIKCTLSIVLGALLVERPADVEEGEEFLFGFC